MKHTLIIASLVAASALGLSACDDTKKTTVESTTTTPAPEPMVTPAPVVVMPAASAPMPADPASVPMDTKSTTSTTVNSK